MNHYTLLALSQSTVGVPVLLSRSKGIRLTFLGISLPGLRALFAELGINITDLWTLEEAEE